MIGVYIRKEALSLTSNSLQQEGNTAETIQTSGLDGLLCGPWTKSLINRVLQGWLIFVGQNPETSKHFRTSGCIILKSMGFWLNAWNKVCGEQAQCIILRHKIHNTLLWFKKQKNYLEKGSCYHVGLNLTTLKKLLVNYLSLVNYN